jgi:hypothetical protein
MAAPIVVTVERAWHHLMRLLSFSALERIRHARAFTFQLHRLMDRR